MYEYDDVAKVVADRLKLSICFALCDYDPREYSGRGRYNLEGSPIAESISVR